MYSSTYLQPQTFYPSKTDPEVFFATAPSQLSGAGAFQLTEQLGNLHLSEAQTLRLSFRNVESIDASGVAALIRIYSNLLHRGIDMEIFEVGERVATLLKKIGLFKLICGAPASHQVQKNTSLSEPMAAG